MENENEQNETRWFLIEHEPEKCGCVIIINVKKFIDAYGKVKGNKPLLICPSCLTEIIGTPALNALFESYENLRKGLGPTTTIRQVQPKYVNAVKDLQKLLDKR